jgi:Tol biopolymer transport system component
MSGFKINRVKILAAAVLVAMSWIFSGTANAQSFGKNKVQYRNFKWKFIQSRHFDVYYYENGKELAEFTADVAESSYVALQKDMRYKIRKRIPILIYNSHNDFEQTNVTPYMLEESVYGFTEIFKDRVVIPYQGNYSEFRHTIHHELTHAVMFQMLYGEAVGSMLTSMARFQLPLWMTEGLAEYESIGWDADSDMYMRDATINGSVPPISMMYGGYMVYKGGQSILNYIAEKYGGPKIGEILGKIRVNRSVEKGLKLAIGLDIDELSERWHKHLRKTYWPDIQDRDEPEDFAKRLTDHEKQRTFLNNSPALSPKGDKLVYLSSRSDYIDIYLMNVIDGKDLGRVVQGERSNLFEELHWLRPGMGWSPDGKRIVFSAKAGPEDALYILDLDTREIHKSYTLGLDGIYSPKWSPLGDKIAFMGMKGNKSDIYTLRLEDEKLEKITDDVFSDLDPVWSPDGKEIAFVSDRGDYLGAPDTAFQIQHYDYDRLDLYTVKIKNGRITRHTFDRAKATSPAYSPDGSRIAYISDKFGISNIFILNKQSGESYPITNVLTGVSQISWSRDGSRLVFSSFFNSGYDLYLMNNPLDIEPGSVVLEKTELYQRREGEYNLAAQTGPEDSTLTGEAKPGLEGSASYKHFVFGQEFRKGRLDTEKKEKEEFLERSVYKDENGDYKSRKYKLRFTPDLITGSAGYSQYFGLQGTSMIALSDILGNHQINIYTDVFYSIKNSNFQVSYFYLPRQTDIGAGIFHYSYLFYTYFTDGQFWYPGYYRDRIYGLSLFLSRPFDRFRRVDFGITGMGIDRDYGEFDPYGFYYGYYTGEYMQDLGNIYRRRLMMVNLGYNTDTVIWGMTGPVNGSRSSFSLSYSPLVSKNNGLEFWTLRGDYRKYFRIKRDYSFVVRMAGGVSDGRNPQRFLLGGMMGWINYQYNDNAYDYAGVDNFYFSSFVTPLRGYPYYEMIGSRFFLTNLEFRFPLIHYLILGWPIPLGFQNIRGSMFLDIGSAWDNDRSWKPFTGGESAIPRLNDLGAGYGFGVRMNLGFFLLKYDIAWKTDFNKTEGKPMHYFTMGAEF